jgi:hypothetical protein
VLLSEGHDTATDKDVFAVRLNDMASENLELARQDVLQAGWCLVPFVAPEEISAFLDRLLPSASVQRHYRDLKPHDKCSAPPASMSAITGTSAQPLHTDGAYHHVPPHYIALQCLNPGEAYCPTWILAPNLHRLRREGPSFLTKPNWVCRGYDLEPFYCPILDAPNGVLRLRFDPLCMRPINTRSVTMDETQRTIKNFSKGAEVGWKRGSLLIIDNWCCVHARGVGAAQAPSRRLRRWYIGASDGLVF